MKKTGKLKTDLNLQLTKYMKVTKIGAVRNAEKDEMKQLEDSHTSVQENNRTMADGFDPHKLVKLNIQR